MTFKIKEPEEQPDGTIKEKVISCLKINNMHPTLETELTYIDFETQTEDYKRLLYKEFDYIKKNIDEVLNKANKLYSKVKGGNDKFFIAQSCNFDLLEREYHRYDPSKTYPVVAMSF